MAIFQVYFVYLYSAGNQVLYMCRIVATFLQTSLLRKLKNIREPLWFNFSVTDLMKSVMTNASYSG